MSIFKSFGVIENGSLDEFISNINPVFTIIIQQYNPIPVIDL